VTKSKHLHEIEREAPAALLATCGNCKMVRQTQGERHRSLCRLSGALMATLSKIAVVPPERANMTVALGMSGAWANHRTTA